MTKESMVEQTNIQTNSEKGAHACGLRPFEELFAAVVAFDVVKMGAGPILTALIKQAGSSARGKSLGLHDTLTIYELTARIQSRAKAKDPLAYGELLFLATITTAMLAEVTDQQNEMALPFVQVSTTFPILQPYYNSQKSDMPLDRLKAMGFGENARAGRLRAFTNGFGLIAILLHFYGVLQRVIQGKGAQVLAEDDSERQANQTWKSLARPTLDEAFAKLSDLPLDEIANLRATRQNLIRGNTTVEVSGYARHEIKGWFVRLRRFARGLRSIDVLTIP